MTTYQMLWDCKYCGTQKLLGVTHRHCPTCGAPQDATARYFPSEADKVRAENHVFVGADVLCPACQEANSKRNEHCFNCGSPLTEAAAVRRRKQREIAEGAAAPIDSKAAAVLEAQSAVAAAQPGPRGKKQGKSGEKAHTWQSDLRTLGWIFGPLVMIFFGLVVVNVVFAKSVQVQAVRHHWVREIAVEQYGDVREGAWCDALPSDARVLEKELKTRSTKKVPDGQTCSTRQTDNGDGSFSEHEVCKTKYRSEPVESLYCTYLVTKWHVDRTEKAEGTSAKDAAWPKTRITRTGQCVGCEREGARKERYELIVRDLETGEEDPCELPENEWRSFEEKATLTADRVPLGGLVCESLSKR